MKASIPLRLGVGTFLIVWMIPERASAQQPPLRGTTLAELVAYAEGEGATHPLDTVPPALMPYLFRGENKRNVPRKCVESAEMGPAHSGEFIIGGQINVENYVPGRRLKIWWAPLHHSRDMKLVVRGTRVGSPSDTLRLLSPNTAWQTDAGPGHVPESKREYFFPSGVSFPTIGKWVVVATQGSDWGCFILNQSSQ